MDLQLKGKNVLVTGGSRGIGLACVREFLHEGARVSLIGRHQEHMDAALVQLREEGFAAWGHCTDLADPSAALAAIDAAETARGEIDILVNSAGAARRTPFHELQPQDWHDAMQAKFFTYVHVMSPRQGAWASGAQVPLSMWSGWAARLQPRRISRAAQPMPRSCWQVQVSPRLGAPRVFESTW